ncbi:hypothetical protein VKT23_011246 [Stygiomarasmius scandens]|uniref:F-box domain-containing protein n=1 Tax=Marasmiellus scandens TaxID=2682957 RepID=A0ABR1J8Y8_9AGAR
MEEEALLTIQDSSLVIKTVQLCDRCRTEISTKERPSKPVSREQLRSAYVPSDAEVSQIKPFIEDAQRDLDLIEAEMGKLEDALAQLQERRKNVQGYLNEYKGFISPIRKLPAEVIGEIFDWCADQIFIFWSDPSKIDASALVLSQTCSLWRNIAISLPRLWARMYINISICSASTLNLVKLYLHRSSPSPLTLDVCARDLRDACALEKELPHWGWETLKSLLLEDNRWFKVSFDLHSRILSSLEQHIPDLWDGWPGSHQHPHLESLSLRWEEHTDLPMSDDFLPMLEHSPNLLSLSIQDYETSFPFHIQQLTRILLHDARHLEGIQHLLGSCPNLRDAGIDLSRYFEPLPWSGQDPVVCGSLHVLKLHFPSHDVASSLLASISVPNLADLAVKGYFVDSDPDQETWLESLGDFLQRSTNIRRLDLSGRLFQSDNELISTLQIVPALTHLTLQTEQYYSGILTGNFFQKMSFLHVPQTDVCLPHLSSLRLIFRDSIPLQEDAVPLPDANDILLLVQSRLQNLNDSKKHKMSSLHFFELEVKLWTSHLGCKWGQQFESEFEHRFRSLEQNGLDLSLKLHHWYRRLDVINISTI